MKCDQCNVNLATTHLTEIVNKKKRELHLCDECKKKLGVGLKSAFGAGGLGSLLENPPVVSQAKLVVKSDRLSGLSCPVCGLTFAEFRATGRLGCANDYLAFERGLDPLLEKIHGFKQHRGKIPAHASQRLERQQQIASLRRELNEAIQREAYERAAELRDQIYKLEEQ